MVVENQAGFASFTAERVRVQVPSGRRRHRMENVLLLPKVCAHARKYPLRGGGRRSGTRCIPGREELRGSPPRSRNYYRDAEAKGYRIDRGESKCRSGVEKRDAAKAEYLARKGRGELVDLRELAEGLGVNYQTLRNWKSADEWEKAEPKKKRGGQPGNRNSTGHKNAAGSHRAHRRAITTQRRMGLTAPSFDTLSEAERELVMNTPVGSRAALEHEMQIPQVPRAPDTHQDHRI